MNIDSLNLKQIQNLLRGQSGEVGVAPLFRPIMRAIGCSSKDVAQACGFDLFTVNHFGVMQVCADGGTSVRWLNLDTRSRVVKVLLLVDISTSFASTFPLTIWERLRERF